MIILIAGMSIRKRIKEDRFHLVGWMQKILSINLFDRREAYLLENIRRRKVWISFQRYPYLSYHSPVSGRFVTMVFRIP